MMKKKERDEGRGRFSDDLRCVIVTSSDSFRRRRRRRLCASAWGRHSDGSRKKMSVEQRRSIDKKTKQKPTMSNSNAIRSPFPLPDISFNYMLGTMA